jgi:diguanylate cyclase (GGDEF)-like protein
MRVLVAEDDPLYRRVLQATLAGWGYSIVEAADGMTALRVLEAADAPRLALLDWVMPGLDGPEVCRALRQPGRDQYVYIVLLTARVGKPDLIQGLEAGADDYLIKPFDPPELQARLNTGKRLILLYEQLLQTREDLRRLATRDLLTGAWNRGAIHDILQRELIRAEREARPVGVVMLDLDHFKRINDTQGHLVGDSVLAEMGQRMVNAIRPYDTLGRYGGEEFLIVLPGCDPATTAGIAERLRILIGETPVPIPDAPVTVTVSVGWAVYPGIGTMPCETLLRQADQALYEAKRTGRNRVVGGPS